MPNDTSDVALRIALHEHDVVNREALQFHGQLQRVTQLTLFVALAAVPLVASQQGDGETGTSLPGDAARTNADYVLLLLGGVFFVLAIVFVAYFRALAANQSYRRKLEARINRLAGRASSWRADGGSSSDEAPLGNSSFIAYWYADRWSNALLGLSWSVQFFFPHALGLVCLAAVTARVGWAVLDPRTAFGVLFYVNAALAVAASASTIAFWWFGRARRHLEQTGEVVAPRDAQRGRSPARPAAPPGLPAWQETAEPRFEAAAGDQGRGRGADAPPRACDPAPPTMPHSDEI